MIVYLLRKHPRYPYGSFCGPAFLEAFTIHGTSTDRKELEAIAMQKNKRSTYRWTVGKLTIGDKK